MVQVSSGEVMCGVIVGVRNEGKENEEAIVIADNGEAVRIVGLEIIEESMRVVGMIGGPERYVLFCLFVLFFLRIDQNVRIDSTP